MTQTNGLLIISAQNSNSLLIIPAHNTNRLTVCLLFQPTTQTDKQVEMETKQTFQTQRIFVKIILENMILVIALYL